MTFNEINGKIQEFIKLNSDLCNDTTVETFHWNVSIQKQHCNISTKKQQNVPKENTNNISILPISDAIFCAEDIVRNKAFFEWIKKAVEDLKKIKITNYWLLITNSQKPNYLKPKASSSILVSVDAWSWIWILWIFALLLWTDKCYFIESNKETLEFSKKLVEYFWLTEKSIFIHWDAKEIKLPEKYDLLVSETLTSWFVDEDFPFIVNNLKKYWKPDSIIIPEKFEIKIKFNSPLPPGEGLGVREEKWNNKEGLDVKVIFQSNLWFKKQKISFRHCEKPEPVEGNEAIQTPFKIAFQTKAYIYKDIIIKSWDCMSFLNKRTISDNNHKLFEFEF